jgi:acyl-CoA thioesterase FadM
MIDITYNYAAKSGKQFTVTVNGSTLANASAQMTLALLRQHGQSVREAESTVAAAKLNAISAAV